MSGKDTEQDQAHGSTPPAAGQASPAPLILEFADALAPDFKRINVEWISQMFTLEAVDLQVLNDPRREVIERGGDILFASLLDLGVVGVCALRPVRGRAVELTKMGVIEAARGRKVGEALLHAAIARGRRLRADPLFLLTNRKCAAAIHLYEKAGFVHDDEIMRAFGAAYDRCDVAMRFAPRGAASAMADEATA